MIAAKRKLIQEGQKILPYIIGGKLTRFVTKKDVNKKVKQRMIQSEYYPQIVEKYRYDKIYDTLFRNIAQILASDFKNIDFYDENLNGINIDCSSISEMICEEMLRFALMI
jgi:Glu-tRNA(Gln) amidotransferase subunit E-like FAD-binding protein